MLILTPLCSPDELQTFYLILQASSLSCPSHSLSTSPSSSLTRLHCRPGSYPNQEDPSIDGKDKITNSLSRHLAQQQLDLHLAPFSSTSLPRRFRPLERLLPRDTQPSTIRSR